MSNESLTTYRPLSIKTEEPKGAEESSISEETVDLGGLFTGNVSSSGSFDMRRFRLETLGKLLDIIPVPALLIDRDHSILFANPPCGRIVQMHSELPGKLFSALFPNPDDKERAHGLIDKVLGLRIPLVAEGIVGTDEAKVLGRMHVRAVRSGTQRAALVVIEDITPQGRRRRRLSDAPERFR